MSDRPLKHGIANHASCMKLTDMTMFYPWHKLPIIKSKVVEGTDDNHLNPQTGIDEKAVIAESQN